MKKRAALEEEHAQGLKKLCRTTYESTRRPDSRQGSYAKNYEDIHRIHERLADNGVQFALSLHQMHEDLQELATDKERGRKQWKLTGLSAEKKLQDSEFALEKAKMKNGRPGVSPPWRNEVEAMDAMRKSCAGGLSTPCAAREAARLEGRATEASRAGYFEKLYRKKARLRE